MLQNVLLMQQMALMGPDLVQKMALMSPELMQQVSTSCWNRERLYLFNYSALKKHTRIKKSFFKKSFLAEIEISKKNVYVFHTSDGAVEPRGDAGDGIDGARGIQHPATWPEQVFQQWYTG